MINQSNVDIQFTWQAIVWRLLLTILLLLVLAGSSLTIFNRVTTNANTRVLPIFTYETGLTGHESGNGSEQFSP